jgi:hypothetical protein
MGGALCPNVRLHGVHMDNFFFPVFKIKGREHVGNVLPYVFFLKLFLVMTPRVSVQNTVCKQVLS